MTTYTGTQEVEPGLYLNTRKFSVTTIDRRGPLPGTTEATYRRVPMLLMLAAAPLLGLVYVIFLPFIGFAALIGYVGYRGWLALKQAAPGMWRVATLEWRPGVAYLGRRAGRATDKESEADRLLRELEEEVAQRRQQGEE